MRVLVIDDDETYGNFLRDLFLREGMEVSRFADGHEGLAALDAARFDIVVCDLYMPGMDGLEILSRLARTHPNLPVVILTGTRQDDPCRRAASKFGAREVLSKGQTCQSIVATVRARAAASSR